MKKQSGFTLIELMVVLAIIALLAVAGLAAYVGYVKKARDTARISDISTINKALTTVLTETGTSPKIIDGTEWDSVVEAIKAVNSGVLAEDPQGTLDVCLDNNGNTTADCGYMYIQCDNGAGFAVSTRFESKVNQDKYEEDGIGIVDDFDWPTASDQDSYWSLGSCETTCDSSGGDCIINDHEPIA